MPYPKPDDPDYCPSSRTPIPNYDPRKQWHDCPGCQRPISAMGKTGKFFPHVSNVKRARRGDGIQKALTAHGLNDKQRFATGRSFGSHIRTKES